jgi:integrase
MTQPNLRIFRRHEAACTAQHPKDFRVYQWMVEKQKGKTATADCSCTIYAEGTLFRNGIKNYIRPRSTDKRTWIEAEAVKANWLKWGDTQPPADTKPEDEAGELVTVQAAVNAYLERKKMQLASGELKQQRFVDVERFLLHRLLPFATVTKRFQYIQEMDHETVWQDFNRSWKNRRSDHKDAALATGTIRTAISTLREFLKYCVKQEWISDNFASEEYMTASSVVEPKEPFSELELSYIYRAARELPTGVGVNTACLPQRVKELLAFVLTLRYTGLRISDVTQLTVDQFQDFQHGGFTHAVWCAPKKTRGKKAVNFVHIPIPVDVAKALDVLTRTPKHGRYFFNAGSGEESSARYTWQRKLWSLFQRAEKMMEADRIEGHIDKSGKLTHFAEHPTPHKFRHTFAATLLQGGAPIRLVAQFLGDTEETVRKHYSKFCREEQEQAATQLASAYKRHEAQTAETRRARLRVVK